MNRFLLTTPFALCLCLISLSISAAPVSKPTIVERSLDKRIWVEQRTINGHLYETIVVNTGRHVTRLPDERVSYINSDGKHSVYNEDGDSRIDHEFFLSPNADWLFVTRKLFHRVDVGYLYHLSGNRPTRIRPQRLRFDEAAIHFYTRHLHIPYPSIDAGARVIRFEGWTDGRLLFSQSMDTNFDGSGRNYDVVGYYGLKSGCFGLISESDI